MEQIIKKAKAKINLGLDVIRRREDGYHEVKMIMQSVDIMDILTFTKTQTHGIKIIAGDSAVVEHIPTDDRNLIYKAAKLLLEKFPEKITGVEIHLEKNIPVAAGMAGGSTDAAATFTAMNELFELELSVEELMRLGVKIGADVPYCIMGGTALSEGIGEILSPVCTPPFCYLVIAKPDLDQMVNNLAEQMYRYRFEHVKDAAQHQRLIEEHKIILESLRSKNNNKASEAVKIHIDNQEKAIMIQIQ